jgi:hypothetical protein
VAGSFAYVPTAGTILGVGVQTLSVTFTPDDTRTYSSAAGSATLTVNKATLTLTVSASAAESSYGNAVSFTANIPNGPAGASVTFYDGAASIGSGTLSGGSASMATSGLEVGSHSITAGWAGDANHDAVSSLAITETVDKAVPQITWTTPAAITYGTVLGASQLDAAASVKGGYAYDPGEGSVLGAGSQPLWVTFTPDDQEHYTTASDHVMLAVERANPVLTWNPQGAIAVGMALTLSQLDAVATSPSTKATLSGDYAYSPGPGTRMTATGAEPLHVVFSPADSTDYTTAEANASLTVLPFGVAAWGDSLTSGNEGMTDQGTYPSELSGLITLPVVNEGAGGQTSTQIGVREGGVSTNATVDGGVIPASGGVGITFETGFEPVTSGGPAGGIMGTLSGVQGSVTLSAGNYTFTRSSAGDATSVSGSTQFVVDTPYSGYVAIFWEGRDNLQYEAQVLSDIAAQVATVPSGRDYAVLSIPTSNDPAEWSSGANYAQIVALNNQLANLYGSHYLDARKALVESYDSTSIIDTSDYKHDEPPTSLRAVYGAGTLGAAIGATDTGLTVNLASGTLTANSILTIDTGGNAENVHITSVSGSTATVVRGFGGNNCAHLAGATVSETDPLHLNAQGYQVIAKLVAQYLSTFDRPIQQDSKDRTPRVQ